MSCDVGTFLEEFNTVDASLHPSFTIDHLLSILHFCKSSNVFLRQQLRTDISKEVDEGFTSSSDTGIFLEIFELN